MRLRFWGVRGSIPSPLTSEMVQGKIAAVVQRITKDDVVSTEAKEKFLSSLPKYLFGTVGSNTACVEVETKTGETIIFDAGTGIRELGIAIMNRPNYKTHNEYHLFISHFHWDHIHGLPFFNPAYDPKNRIVIYSTRKNAKKFLEEQMKYPYFPISMLGDDGFNAKIEFRYIEPDEKYIHIGDVDVGWHRVRHPGGCTSYSVIEGEKKIIYSTDTELKMRDFEDKADNIEYYSDAELMIIDAQYTLTDALQKKGWGHSTYSIAVDFAVKWRIKKVGLFHHEPIYSDKKIFSFQRSAEWYKDYPNADYLSIIICQEGMELEI